MLGHSGQGGSAPSVHTKCRLGLRRRCTSELSFGAVKWEMHTGFDCWEHLTLKYYLFSLGGGQRKWNKDGYSQHG